MPPPKPMSDEALVGFILVSAVYLALVLFVMSRQGPLEGRLIVLGLVSAVAAIWYGSLAQPLGSGVPAGLARIALILVLGGVGLTLFNRWTIAPATPNGREGVPHVP